MGEKCKDYGGKKDNGDPCHRDAGWGVDGENEGRCTDHRAGNHWSDKAERVKPIDLLKKLQNGVLDPERVGTAERRACLPVLCWDQGKTYEEAAEIFDVSKGTIGEDWQKIKNGWAKKVVQVSSSELAAEVFQSIKRDATKLRNQGKYEAANRVIARGIETLQDLGLVDKQADEVNINWVNELEDL